MPLTDQQLRNEFIECAKNYDPAQVSEFDPLQDYLGEMTERFTPYLFQNFAFQLDHPALIDIVYALTPLKVNGGKFSSSEVAQVMKNLEKVSETPPLPSLP